jgi:hypothetical protein
MASDSTHASGRGAAHPGDAPALAVPGASNGSEIVPFTAAGGDPNLAAFTKGEEAHAQRGQIQHVVCVSMQLQSN